ncbi:crotonase/enoyl-CoA hydratase family protein [Aureimonas sp. ME7]|uniref:crotonase/enoyl-CoA hydratase family protein n=1 Tax=Aureimonas sp. ME7 TaxID=2744252 RepID=UPI0015F73721|nr:crotonase/enoyl-CoA hydratase family protein [Aureimonas sp. ME7]
MSQHIRTSIEHGVLTIRIDRPDKKNALDRAMYAALADALRAGEGDASVGAIVFLGVPGAFSSGNDIADFAAFAKGDASMAELEAFLHALAEAGKPLLAGVDGLAIGIGTTLLLHCDLAFATPRSVFRTPFVDLGLVPEAASSLLAPRLMGHKRTFQLLVMGEPLDAVTAREFGIVSHVVEDAEAGATEAARRLAAKPREAVRLSRQLLRAEPAEVVSRIELEARHFLERLHSGEAQAAFAAFMRKG